MAGKQRRQVGRPATIEAPRETILVAAATLFATNGYENTSLQDVAKTVGVSKAAVYHYFSTKQQIYDEIAIAMLRKLEAFVREKVAIEKRGEDRIRAFMIAHATFMEQNLTGFVTLLHGQSGTVRSAAEIAARDSYESMLRGILRDAADRSEIRVDNVATASVAILSMLNWMSRWFRPEMERRAAEFAQDYYTLLFTGLKA
ncbi:AcrR family transcriptional regulator [Neorhizobium galegae]|uniref:TetR/AcrR family transcriptional regulator n=1 Tax=Neorhizobium galegae TaxID=399 RepID=UPI002780ED26|nr:TetR/AcrR family transcriptional regulator [Neorhizobium galegae]MDQ0137752.1 AcrR family transcriptional regulator [Neorhizobium galegae]